MDLKNKRVIGSAQIILFAAILALYTRIGGMGMIYAAGSMELFYIISYLFLGGLPDAMEYMILSSEKKDNGQYAGSVCKAGVLYAVTATVLIELLLFITIKILIGTTDLLYVDKLLGLLMFTVPFLALSQVLLGIMQSFFDKIVAGLAKLIFVMCMVLTTSVSAIVLRDYGSKAASLMQSMKMEHFYVVIGIVPGVLVGALGTIIFLMCIWLTHKEQVPLLGVHREMPNEKIFPLTAALMKSQMTEVVVPICKHIPITVLFLLCLREVSSENYLFGDFYGAILPLFGIVWTGLDLGLTSYKKRLYSSYRKKDHEQFYKDLKTILCYIILHSMAIFAFSIALHRSYLAIWNMQNYVSFMELALASSALGLIGLSYMVFGDILKYRGLQSQYVFSVASGVAVSVLGSILYAKYIGQGTWLYLCCVGLQFLVTIALCAWSISSVVGIHYLSVIIRTAGSIICTFVIAVVLYGIQRLVFTALGGLGTLIICLLTGIVLQFLLVYSMRVYDKEEMKDLPSSFITKYLSKNF